MPTTVNYRRCVSWPRMNLGEAAKQVLHIAEQELTVNFGAGNGWLGAGGRVAPV